MIVTLTNTSGGDLNNLAAETGGVGVSALYAVGGARENPLPYPFGHVGTLANAATSVLAMHPADWRYKTSPSRAMFPHTQWNALIMDESVTLATAAETDFTEAEEEYIAAV
jgi:hypothetical protein